MCNNKSHKNSPCEEFFRHPNLHQEQLNNLSNEQLLWQPPVINNGLEPGGHTDSEVNTHEYVGSQQREVDGGHTHSQKYQSLPLLFELLASPVFCSIPLRYSPNTLGYEQIDSFQSPRAWQRDPREEIIPSVRLVLATREHRCEEILCHARNECAHLLPPCIQGVRQPGATAAARQRLVHVDTG